MNTTYELSESLEFRRVLFRSQPVGARAHGLEGHGAIAPGYRADLVVLEDLSRFAPSLVLAGGRVAARDGRAEPFDAPEIPAHVVQTVRSAPITAADLALDADGAARVRVIDIDP